MNARKLILLSLAALVIIIAAVWIGRSRAPESAAQQNLYPDLKGKLDSVTGISVFKAGDQLAVEIARDGDTWKVKQRGSYLADGGKVKSLLFNLEGAKLREQKTANPANYSALAVQDLSDVATTGVRVELAGVPVKLIVGKRDVNARATYVRRAGEAQSWFVGTELDIPVDPTQWLKHDVLSIGADRIQEVVTQLAGGPSYSSFKKTRADANFDVKPIPKARELNSVAAPNAVAQALVSLQLEDVRAGNELASEKNPSHATFRTFDGLVVECTGYAVGDKRWITLHANFDSALAKRFFIATAAPESKDEKKDEKKEEKKEPATDTSLETAIKKGQDEANTLNSNLSTWAFALPTYKYDAIFKPLEDLLKKPEPLKKK